MKIKKQPFQITEKGKLKQRVNTLELENETLKNVVKDELYKVFMNKLGEPMEIERLKKDNKKLRKKNKVLKELLKEENNSKRRRRDNCGKRS